MGEGRTRYKEPQDHDHEAGEDLDSLLGEKRGLPGAELYPPKNMCFSLDPGTWNVTPVELELL